MYRWSDSKFDAERVYRSLSLKDQENYCAIHESDKDRKINFFEFEENLVVREVLLFEETPIGIGEAEKINPDDTGGNILLSVAVNPKYRHQGIGSKIVQKLIEELDKTNFVKLNWVTLRDNKESIRLAKRIGFKPGLATVHRQNYWFIPNQKKYDELTEEQIEQFGLHAGIIPCM